MPASPALPRRSLPASNAARRPTRPLPPRDDLGRAARRRDPRRRAAALLLAIALPALLALSALFAPPAGASVIMDTTLSSLPGDSRITLLDIGSATGNTKVSGATWYFGGANSVSFAGSAGIYHGTIAGTAAAPTLNGSAVTTNYFAAEPSGAVTFSYTSPQKYFGLVWGSIDTYNALSFYDGATLVATFVGTQITPNPTGSQAADGSKYVSFNFTSSSQFTRVVATSTSPAFEFLSMGYASVNIPLATGTGSPTVVSLASTPTLPGPGPAALLPGLLAFALLRRAPGPARRPTGTLSA